MNSLIHFLTLFTFISTVFGQQAFTFTQDGRLDAASADSSDYNTGGSMTVNGFTITVPKNFIVTFPNAWVPWKNFTGSPVSFLNHEVLVFGNVIDGKPVAAMMEIAQDLAHFGSAFVESVDVADGSLVLVGGSRLRINDPRAIFSKGYTANPFFTADDESASITAFSGFPMCIPRSSNDPLCPSSNRPSNQRTFQAPDPLLAVPFAAGDYIEFAGIRTANEVVAYELAALNVQVTTTGVPSYIRIEEALIGVVDQSTQTEFTDTRFVGYTSDGSISVTIAAIDVDPCTGDETFRPIGAATPRAGELRNRFIFRTEGIVPSNYTREYRILASNGAVTTKNGLNAGSYVTPVTEWVFPELLIPGVDPPINDFTHMGFLTNGWNIDGVSFGALSPWVGLNPAPTGTVCSTPAPNPTFTGIATPTANAGADFAVRPGVLVTLSGSQNNTNARDSDLTTVWSQVAGPTVTIASANAAKATFTAPSQSTATPTIDRTFALTISRIDDPTIFSTDNVTVRSDTGIADTVTIDSFTWTTRQGGTLSVVCRSNVINGDSTSMTLNLSGPSAGTFTMVNNGAGVYSYDARSTRQPTAVNCVSNLGGSASRTSTTAKRSLSRRAKAALAL